MSTSVYTCAICMRELAGGAPERKMKCGHVFHRVCVDAWLEKHHTCPECRNPEREPEPAAAGPSWADLLRGNMAAGADPADVEDFPDFEGLGFGNLNPLGVLPDGSVVVESVVAGTAEEIAAMVEEAQRLPGVQVAFARGFEASPAEERAARATRAAREARAADRAT